MSGICDTFSGSITGEVLSFNPDAIPEPDTLVIRMTRGELRIADELRKQFGGFKCVVIDVDTDRHEFSADSLIRLLEEYEGARDVSRYAELFGTPERAASTFMQIENSCSGNMVGGVEQSCATCPANMSGEDYPRSRCYMRDDDDYDALLEWLMGDA